MTRNIANPPRRAKLVRQGQRRVQVFDRRFRLKHVKKSAPQMKVRPGDPLPVTDVAGKTERFARVAYCCPEIAMNQQASGRAPFGKGLSGGPTKLPCQFQGEYIVSLIFDGIGNGLRNSICVGGEVRIWDEAGRQPY